jgi:hypothetical protein
MTATATKKQKRERVEQRAYHGDRQSWNYCAIWKIFGETLRIMIRVNAYDFQSYRVCDIYDRKGKRWYRLCSLPYGGMHSAPNSYVKPEVDMKLFEMDEAELLAEAEKILR